MNIFDHIFHRESSAEQNKGKLSSYRQAAELICMCWNRLDMSIVEPFLDENVVWKGGIPHKVINGKANYLKLTQLLPFELFSKKFCLNISELGLEIV